MADQRTPAQRRAEAEARARQRAAGATGPVPAADPSVPRRRAAPATVRRRRRAAAALALVVLLATGVWVAGLGSEQRSGAGTATTTAAAAPPAPQLPGGGRRLFPDRRVVAFAGNPSDPGLGALGVGRATTMIAKLRRQARAYERRTRPVLPALELITSVAAADAGAVGDHVLRTDAAVIDRHLRLARRTGALLLLDVQPGYIDFPREIRRLARWLREPDVGLALDPEWRVEPPQRPGEVIGSVSAEEINATSAIVAEIVRARRLPEKLFVVHQFTDSMVRNPERLLRRAGLAMVFNVDGVGARANKIAKYRALAAGKAGFRHGFKLFYEEDQGLMSPRDVMALQPRPDLVVYE